MAKWKVVVEGEERVFDTAEEAARFAVRALASGARRLEVQRVWTWRERLTWAVKRLLSKPLRVRVLLYRLQYRKRQPPLTLPL
ncbi:MAG: hypothetical protein QXM12_04220 [Nitrososphaerota archaeon]